MSATVSAPVSAPAPATVSAPDSGSNLDAAWTRRPAITASAAWLHGFGGFGPAFGPVLRASIPAPLHCIARLSGMATITRPELTGHAGAALLEQQIVTVDLVRPLAAPTARLIPLISFAAGLHHLRADGRGAPSYMGTSEHAWSAAAAPGLGLAARLTPRIAILLDAHALLLLPEPRVEIAREPAGRAGTPMLLASLGATLSL